MKPEMKASLQWQWENSTRKSQALCGRVPIAKNGYVSLFSSPTHPIISGLMRCSSPSTCVVCSSRIAKARGTWLSEVFHKAIEQGFQISMLTLTVRHKRSDRLDNLLKAMEQAYTNVQGSTSYKALRNDYDSSFIRVLEVTHGKNGFHPHYHIAIIHRPGFDFELLRADMERTWVTHIERQGLLAPIPDKAVHIVHNASDEQRAWYLTKACGMSSLEVSNGRYKTAKGDNLGIWQIHGLAVSGDLDSKYVWHAYEKAIFKKRLFTMSKGMADKFGVIWRSDVELASDEVSDLEGLSLGENIADNLQKVALSIEFVGALSPFTWKQICERRLNGALYDLLRTDSPDVGGWLVLQGIGGGFFTPTVMSLRYDFKDDLLKCLQDTDISTHPADFDYFESQLQNIGII